MNNENSYTTLYRITGVSTDTEKKRSMYSVHNISS